MGDFLSMGPSERVYEIQSVLRLGCVPGIGTRALWRILTRFGSGRRALEGSRGELDGVAGMRCSDALASPELDRRVCDALERCRTLEIEILLWSDEEYPDRLRHLVDPPPVLFARGRLELLSRPAVTIVGSRRSTAYGRRSAEALAAQMALRGITVVSGLALGIDGASHRGALEAGGDTIAVLGSGVDLIQPASHRRLGERVAREGLLLSEFLPGEPARAHHFPRRNRILAALGGAVVVVEAAEKSGALITVEHALDLGRDVYAVPGALDAPQSRGCNLLIRQGAQVITSPEEFGRDLGLVCGTSSDFRAARGSSSVAREVVPAGLDDEERRVWLALSERSLGIDDVASGADLQSARVLAALTILQVGGLVVQESGMRFRRAS
ncbi:MAG: DNA-protecting protein DprA [Gemmatimonadetes bacterium]|nr:DNA-protecting protein DprA [Gemmatimonadota bacterium]